MIPNDETVRVLRAIHALLADALTSPDRGLGASESDTRPAEAAPEAPPTPERPREGDSEWDHYTIDDALRCGWPVTRREGDSDLTEEPEVGAMVVDRDGDVWKRDDDDEGWKYWLSASRGWSVGRTHRRSWDKVRDEFGPFRLATPDDLTRVGITEPSVGGSEPAADSDDEALAKVLLNHIGRAQGMTWANTMLRDEYLKAARAAREHIEAAHQTTIEVNQTTIERLTAQRDDANRLVKRRDEQLARLTERNVDFGKRNTALVAERDIAVENQAGADEALRDALEEGRLWQAKHAALRGDVERHRGQCAENADDTTASYGYRGRCAHTEDTLKVILRSDANRDPQPPEPDADTVTLRREGLTEPTILRMAADDLRHNHHLGFNGLPRSLPGTLEALAAAMEADQ